MADKTLKTRIKLKRDNSYNWNDSFVPLKGEICLIDTPEGGLRVKCGDGSKQFSQLEYIDDILIKGYFLDGNFYQDSAKIYEASKNINRIYIDLSKSQLYIYNGTNFELVGGSIVSGATTEIPGVLKLYDTLGNNTDGTINQKVITEELNKKVEVSVDDEMIVLTTGII